MAKVLIIDDDDVVLDSCRAILEAAGFDVRTATNGRVGQQVFETDPADGHPVRIDIDHSRNAMDDESCFVISDYDPT